jgi:hypothetical protein
MGAYYSFATNFGFTPKQVDELDLVTAQGMSIIGDAVAKESERAMRRGRQ